MNSDIYRRGKEVFSITLYMLAELSFMCSTVILMMNRGVP